MDNNIAHNNPSQFTSKDSAVSIKDKYMEQLDSDYQMLTEIVLAQMELILKQMEDAHNEEVVFRLKQNEKRIDSLDITIIEKVVNAIFLFTPRAVDLRRLMAYHDMTIAMERVGDLIMNISGSLQKMDLSKEGFDLHKDNAQKLFDRTNTMIKNVIFAFNEKNKELAYTTIMMDDKVDKLDKKMERKLAETFAGQTNDQQTLINIMNLNAISYYFERIGDKAVDIAESAIFLIEGKDIRHAKRKDLPDFVKGKDE